MEAAILPLLGLGAFFVISSQNKNSLTKNKNPLNEYEQYRDNEFKENYTNMGQSKNYLSNTDLPPENYPIDTKDLEYPEQQDSVMRYENPNKASDTYFDQNNYETRVNNHQRVGQNPQEVYSLTGNYLDSAQFKHDNMRPFFAKKPHGYTYDNQIAETVLDNMMGTGSQVIRKIEQAPLFKPQENVQYPYGAPNQSDFYQSRVNPSMRNNNVKPFDSEYVAPGLGLGATTEGMGGFNSGMLVRDTWLDRNVDELRVLTNPKIEYDLFGHEGPGNSHIKNRGYIGVQEKNRPDRFYINSQDRYFTTTGAAKGESLRPVQELGVIRRPEGATDYMGPAGGSRDRRVGRAPTSFEHTRRTQLAGVTPTNAAAVNRGDHTDKDMYARSHNNYANHRSTTAQPETYRSGFSSAIGAVIAPFTDMLRPTRKEEIAACGSVCRGSVQVPQKEYVTNPYDVLPTTVKETTLYSSEFNIGNQNGGQSYVPNAMPGHLTMRDTTNCSYMGPAGGAATTFGDMDYTEYYNQNNNEKKSSSVVYNYTNSAGGLSLFNGDINQCTARQDSNCYDNYSGPAVSIIKSSAFKENIGHISSKRVNETEGSSAGRNQDFVVQKFLQNPYSQSLTTSV